MDEKIENIKRLLKNEFGDDKSEVLSSLNDYRTIKIERLQALNVYTIRYRIKVGKGEANRIIGYPRLLKSLAESKDPGCVNSYVKKQ